MRLNPGGASPPEITFTITTCKRLDLFRRTMDSFLACCADADRIGAWICVDDDSSADDRAAMERLYPRFAFYWKTPAERGHARSLNILRSLVRSPYVLHVEDDWEFVDRGDYCAPALEILADEPSIGQVLFNRNYAETLRDVRFNGGVPRVTARGRSYILHEHYAPGTPALEEFQRRHPGPSCAYWPHYSLRPSILRSQVWAEVGPFDESPARHFELAYADAYTRRGFRSAFFDAIRCLHIGRLTTQADDPTTKNAYQLNGQPQFGALQPGTVTPRAEPLIADWSPDDTDDPRLVEEAKYLIERYALRGTGRRLLRLSDDHEATGPEGIEPLADRCVTITSWDLSGRQAAALERLYSAPVSYRFGGKRIVLPRAWITIDRDVPIRVLNLERRPDRWRRTVKTLFAAGAPWFSRVPAVDGRDLEATEDTLRLFRDNDFGFRRGVVGCALSHVGLWKELAAAPSADMALLVFEDDVVLHRDFLAQWSRRYDELRAVDPEWDLLFLGTHGLEVSGAGERRVARLESPPPGMIGGMFAYMIRRSAARKLLGWIAANGIRHGIDYVVMTRLPAMKGYAVVPHIAFSDFVSPGRTIDSDIQYDGTPVARRVG